MSFFFGGYNEEEERQQQQQQLKMSETIGNGDDEDENITVGQLIAFVFIGCILLGIFITIWNYFWPKVKGFWSYMIPFTLAYTLLRVIEFSIQLKLVSLSLFFVKPILKILCKNTPDILPNYYCLVFNSTTTTTPLW